MTRTAHVENLLYGGRTLVGYTEEGDRVAGWAEVAYESIRAINDLTLHGPIPAPTAYRILGDLKGVGHLLPQALEQLARGSFHTAYPDVPIGLTEYGADANPRFQSEVGERGDYSEQYQAAYHEHLINVIEDRPWLWATYVWNLCDFGADGRSEGGAPGRNQKGLVSFDRSLKKDAFYLYKAAWSAEPFVHVAGRRYVDRTGASTTVTVYSNQPEVTLSVDGEPLGRRTGRRVFRFQVPLSGEHEVVARAGEVSDTIRIRRAAQPNPDYRLNDAGLTNWFDGGELPRPDGRYSIYDTFGSIKAHPAGRVVADQLMAPRSLPGARSARRSRSPRSCSA